MGESGQFSGAQKKIGKWGYSETLSSNTYLKVASSNTSPLEAHAGFFRWLMKGIFNPYVL